MSEVRPGLTLFYELDSAQSRLQTIEKAFADFSADMHIHLSFLEMNLRNLINEYESNRTERETVDS